MLKIRRPLGRLIFNMGITIPGKTVFLIETAPCIVEKTKTMLKSMLSTRLFKPILNLTIRRQVWKFLIKQIGFDMEFFSVWSAPGVYHSNFLRELSGYFLHVFTNTETFLSFIYRIHIWQMSTKLSCGNTCQIWIIFKSFIRQFYKIKKIL